MTGLDINGCLPSIPFVSLQAACPSVGRLLATHLGVDTPGNFIQYDSLIGRHRDHAGTPDCICRTRAHTIDKVRTARSGTGRWGTVLPRRNPDIRFDLGTPERRHNAADNRNRPTGSGNYFRE